MLNINITENKLLLYPFIISAIFLIGIIDYYSDPQFSFSLFYVFPILLIAIKTKTKIFEIILVSLFAGMVWFVCEYYSNTYSSVLFPIWNSIVRFLFFSSISLLLNFLKKRELKISKMNKKLMLLNQEKNKFIGIAAHDLANPIGSIYALSELMLENQTVKKDEEIEESFTIIKDLSHNTLGVLKNLLNVSVIESGKIELKLEQNNYIEFLSKQVTFNALLASKKRINIQLETFSEVVLLDFDKILLSQVVNNLLTNALKFSYPDSTITIRISEDENNQIYTEVIDQGKGIPEKDKQKLFNYFQKASTQPTNGETSTGLGLAIAKQIITLHEGTIGVFTKENQGSNFHYTLPKHHVQSVIEKTKI